MKNIDHHKIINVMAMHDSLPKNVRQVIMYTPNYNDSLKLIRKGFRDLRKPGQKTLRKYLEKNGISLF